MTDEKPRIRFRDYRCQNCGRLLMRSNLDSIVLNLPIGFSEEHPLAAVAMKFLVVECRCPKCGLTNAFRPAFNGNSAPHYSMELGYEKSENVVK